MPRAVLVFICSAWWRKKPMPPRRITFEVRKNMTTHRMATPARTATGLGM